MFDNRIFCLGFFLQLLKKATNINILKAAFMIKKYLLICFIVAFSYE